MAMWPSGKPLPLIGKVQREQMPESLKLSPTLHNACSMFSALLCVAKNENGLVTHKREVDPEKSFLLKEDELPHQ
jgi:hypothetical protein